ncbi:MAG: class I SAM-dependent methyltransferase [Candidatus Bathyarchaeota archaeon]|nr:MAG: class I SAM-dependent methyltransferase [Candidatus Bathyarchaeota archaeon]
MCKNDLRIFYKYYDQIYLKRKDYENESQTIRQIIKQFEKKPSKTLLDIGCGTGEHLKYLSQSLKCKGLDISEEMIKKAKAKVADAEFETANMIDFSLDERFDVIICLFGSIGYVQTFRNLVRTFKNFLNHQNNEGLTIIAPWVFRKDFRKGAFSIDTYEDDETKLVRMGTSKLTRSHWLVYFHYLIGKDESIKYSSEVHKMLAADYEDYINAFSLAGYSETEFLKEDEGAMRRGLFVAIK